MTTTPIVGSENVLCRAHRRLARSGGVGRHEVASDALEKADCVTGGTGRTGPDRRNGTEKSGARLRSCPPGAGLPVIIDGTDTHPPRETGAGKPTARGVRGHAATFAGLRRFWPNRSGRTARRYIRRDRGMPSLRHCDTAESLTSHIRATAPVPPRASITRLASAFMPAFQHTASEIATPANPNGLAWRNMQADRQG